MNGGGSVVPEPWTERALLDRLCARHTPASRPGNGPKWCYMEHVHDGPGFQFQTTIDALAMCLWPSSGMPLHAFEVKTSRSDWRRELANPEKSAPWLAAADFFWVVAPPGVVKREELPEAWGLLEARGTGLRASVQAAQLQPLVTVAGRLGDKRAGLPDIRRGLVAAMLRASMKQARSATTEAAA